MQAVILAAGEGKRLRPFTEAEPKVMLSIANRPILSYILEALVKNGIQDIIIVTGYKKEVIMDYFKNYDKAKITYAVQDKQLGTAHALLQAKKYIKGPFIVLAGDNIIGQKSITKLIANTSEYALLIKENQHPSKYGVVVFEKKKLTNIVEKPQYNEMFGKFISTGVYKLPRSIFSAIEEVQSQGVHALSAVIQSLITQGKTINTIPSDLWMDVVYPWDLLQMNEQIIQNTAPTINGVVEKGVTIKGAVSIGEKTTIYAGTYIVGPVVIGSGCEIGPHACIFPSTTIGNNSVVHPFTEIRNCVIMNDVHIGSNSCLKHSIIGRGTIIENNFSSVSGKASIELEGEYKKVTVLGTMIGSSTTIESQVVVSPGVIIGQGCSISAMKNITKNIPSGSKVM